MFNILETREKLPKEFVEQGNEPRILLKGTGYGIRVILRDDAAEDELLEEARSSVDELIRIAGNTGLVIDCKKRRLTPDFLSRLLCDFVWAGGFRVLSWTSDDTETLELFRNTGFTVGEPISGRPDGDRFETGSLILTQSLRSGQMVEHDGDVMLLGHMNEGAEIRASGNIFVHGRLKGVVHAGTRGGEHGVWAERFEATQVRIGGKICSSLGRESAWWGKAVLIALENGQLVARELKLDSAS